MKFIHRPHNVLRAEVEAAFDVDATHLSRCCNSNAHVGPTAAITTTRRAANTDGGHRTDGTTTKDTTLARPIGRSSRTKRTDAAEGRHDTQQLLQGNTRRITVAFGVTAARQALVAVVATRSTTPLNVAQGTKCCKRVALRILKLQNLTRSGVAVMALPFVERRQELLALRV
jgi:hypothetical protein